MVLAATLGTAIGATAFGFASAATATRTAMALEHIPTTAHGSSAVSAVQTPLVGSVGGAGGGVGAGLSVRARALGTSSATVVGR